MSVTRSRRGRDWRDGRWAMETLLRDLPGELLRSSCARLVGDVERLHQANERSAPEWLYALRAHYTGAGLAGDGLPRPMRPVGLPNGRAARRVRQRTGDGAE